jgi:hypothetical protein
MLPKRGVSRVYAPAVPDHPANPVRPADAGPPVLQWDHAPTAILKALPSQTRSAVVRIAGPVGSGKSTLARRLAAAGEALLISTDEYLPDYDTTPEHLRDEPAASHLDELAGHLAELRAGRAVDLPVWCFHEHRRIGRRTARPAPLIVVEGIHALQGVLDSPGSLAVLVHADTGVRWARWEALEASGQRGWGVERARAFFDAVAEPTFARHRPAYLARADYLVINDG